MKAQNEKLKKEFAELKAKLQDCLAKVKVNRRPPHLEKVERTEEELCKIIHFMC